MHSGRSSRKAVGEKTSWTRYLPLRWRRAVQNLRRYLRDHEETWVFKWLKRYFQFSLMVKCLVVVSCLWFQGPRWWGPGVERIGVLPDVPRYNGSSSIQLAVLSKGNSYALEQLLIVLDEAEIDRVDIHFVVRNSWMRLLARRRVLNLLGGFRWEAGRKSTHLISVESILDVWRPRERRRDATTLYTLFLVDEVELSPSFYTWLKKVVGEYRFRQNIAGFSLQLAPGTRPEGTNIVFHQRAPDMVAFAPRREVWLDFLSWMKAKRFQVGGFQFQTLFTKFCEEHDLYVGYPNIGNGEALAVVRNRFSQSETRLYREELPKTAKELHAASISFISFSGNRVDANVALTEISARLARWSEKSGRIVTLVIVTDATEARANAWLDSLEKAAGRPPGLVLLCNTQSLTKRLGDHEDAYVAFLPDGSHRYPEEQVSEISWRLIASGVSVLHYSISKAWYPSLAPMILSSAGQDAILPQDLTDTAFAFVRSSLAAHCAYVSIRREREWLSLNRPTTNRTTTTLADQDFINVIVSRGSIPSRLLKGALNHLPASLTWRTHAIPLAYLRVPTQATRR